MIFYVKRILFAISIKANEAFFVWGLIFGLELDAIDSK